MSAEAPRSRRVRTVTESLLSIVLALEMFLVFFATIVVFGLQRLPAPVAFIGGGVLVVLLIVAVRLLRYPVGIWLALALQVVLIALGLLEPLMYLIGAGFAAMFVYYLVKGRQIDRRNAASAPDTREGE
ncbi:DUF4233 domain-containing protein [Diaminobutyricimonas sp. TR449]|uniref:DUF4233 domain-containing protein n=1 Tax=Diaminobutyricimonas sp. TR449 TaxID=2708076 RepID=UPI0014242CA2|nr:DUF4233 domain-containing protein [Diaminobutyricimonas sp. TR449]